MALDFLFEKGRIFYIAELGVVSSLRKKGFGEQLSRTLITAVREYYGIRCFVLRTHIEATAAKGLYAKLGFKELPIQEILPIRINIDLKKLK